MRQNLLLILQGVNQSKTASGEKEISSVYLMPGYKFEASDSLSCRDIG